MVKMRVSLFWETVMFWGPMESTENYTEGLQIAAYMTSTETLAKSDK